MNDTLKWVANFVDAIAIIVALVFVISLVHRSRRGHFSNNVMMGGVFAFAIVITMSDPIPLPRGTGIFDMRMLLVGTATAMFGPIVGGVAFFSAASYRMIIGGPGMFAGLCGIALVFCVGLIWRYKIKDKDIPLWNKSLVLGGMLSCQVFVIFLLPQIYWAEIFPNLAPYMILSSIFGAQIIVHLLSGELSFISQAETSRIDANTDHLTGLLNRRGMETFGSELSKVAPQSLGQALLYFDIDKFKDTNDTYGHATGDEVLRHVVDQVAANLRKKDTFVRFGGDEFVVILPDIDDNETTAISERCRCVVEKSEFEVGFAIVPITISVGAVWSETPTELDVLLEIADKALYQAKDAGRNRVIRLASTCDLNATAA